MPLLDVFLPSEPIEVLETATPEAVVELLCGVASYVAFPLEP